MDNVLSAAMEVGKLTPGRFSAQAQSYSRFRPEYPPALYGFLLRLVPARELAWDCGTGSGQAARALACYFARVVATDVSSEQIRFAAAPSNVSFQVAEAETPDQFPPASVDLVTAAQAAHWFEPGPFYETVSAALKPNGVIAIWGYGFGSITPEIDAILHPYGREFLTPYWSERNSIVLEGYRQFPFPFVRIEAPRFQMRAKWTLAHLKGYLDSWSATQAYKVRVGRDPFDAIEASLTSAWGDPARSRQIAWELTVLAGRNKTPAP
jgi:SAM-dependent methyltransferase